MRKNLEQIIKQNFDLSPNEINNVLKKIEQEFDLKTILDDLDDYSIIEIIQEFLPKNNKKIAHLSRKISGSKNEKKFFDMD